MSARSRRQETDVELGEEVEPTIRSRTPVVAIRVSPDLFERVNDYASARGLTLSDVFRQGVERLITGTTSVVTSGGFIPATIYRVDPLPQGSAHGVEFPRVDLAKPAQTNGVLTVS